MPSQREVKILFKSAEGLGFPWNSQLCEVWVMSRDCNLSRNKNNYMSDCRCVGPTLKTRSAPLPGLGEFAQCLLMPRITKRNQDRYRVSIWLCEAGERRKQWLILPQSFPRGRGKDGFLCIKPTLVSLLGITTVSTLPNLLPFTLPLT